MKTINLWASILFIVGLLVYILMGFLIQTEGSGYFAMWIGWPLMLIGIICWIIGFFVRNK